MFFLQTYFIVTPRDILPDTYHAPTVYMEYTLGQSGCLLRHKDAAEHRGGMMGINLQNVSSFREKELLSAITGECALRRYRGIVLLGNAMPQSLLRLFKKQSLPVFLPSQYASEGLIGILDTALSGGSLKEHLSAHAGSTPALYIEQNFVDFTLPDRLGQGRALSQEEFRSLYEKYAADSYFSHALCARYFTYIVDHQAHFVLFDDIQTIREKQNLGAQFGFSIAFLPYALLQQ